ncbi:MAG: RNA methyltransferase, partial [Chloroflexaceae bacterium]|nr:RNA methyltransferase [Chloroflexaceae bacterium]
MNPRRYRKFKEVLAQRQLDLTVLSEDVHKPHNISALLRTCDAVGIFELHMVNRLGPFPLSRAIARGTDKWVLVQAHRDIQTAIAELRSRGFGVYAAHVSEGAVDYRQIDYTQPTAILLGAE